MYNATEYNRVQNEKKYLKWQCLAPPMPCQSAKDWIDYIVNI